MFNGLKLLLPCALALYLASACQPDLDSLSVDYTASGGTGNSDGGMSNGGGALTGCENGKKDPNESDSDCGGISTCDRCAVSSACTKTTDCQTPLYCKTSTKKCTAPDCDDGIQNGDETGDDCGGSCDACDIDAPCSSNIDCEGRYCLDGFCADHCLSGKIEADETATDCGGESCPKCANGLKCIGAGDCASGVCFNQKCQAPSCMDGIKNQDESFEDCGGVCSGKGKPCDVGIPCNGPADCESWVCGANGKCALDPVVVLATAILDDFEDSDFNLPMNPALENRVGQWYQFGDGTGSASYDVSVIERGASHKGFTMKGKDFKMWGSGIGTDMVAAKAPYDASQYTGLTFWARANLPAPANEDDIPTQTLTVVFPDADTDLGGGLCTTCDHHYNKPVQLLEKWQRFTVKFAELILEPGTLPPPGPFKANGIVSVQFRVAFGQTYDLYLDDIAFVK